MLGVRGDLVGCGLDETDTAILDVPLSGAPVDARFTQSSSSSA
jgi:hypothetical protein